MDVTIRKLEEKDFHKGFLESLSHLFKVDLTPKESKKIYERMKDNPVYHIFAAEFEGEIVGVITLLIEQKYILKGAKFGYLEDLAVRVGFERRGIGKLLVEAVINEAKQEGCRLIRLDCNDEVALLYEKCGFHKKNGVNRMQINLLPHLY